MCAHAPLSQFGSRTVALHLQTDRFGQAFPTIDHFTVGCLAAWPLNESEAGGDLALIETSLLFLCKLLLISMRTTSLL